MSIKSFSSKFFGAVRWAAVRNATGAGLLFLVLWMTLVMWAMSYIAAGAQAIDEGCQFEPITYLGRQQVFTAQPGNELLVESNDLGIYAWDVVTTTTQATNRPLDVYERPAGGREPHASEYRTSFPVTETVVLLGDFLAGETVRVQVIDNSGNATSRGNLRIFNGHVLYAADTSPRVVNFEYVMPENSPLHLAHQDTIAWTVCSFGAEATPTDSPTATATLTPTLTSTPTPTLTLTATPTQSSTPTDTATLIATPTSTPTPVMTPPMLPPTATATATATNTPGVPKVATLEPTATATPNCIDGESAPDPENCPLALPTTTGPRVHVWVPLVEVE